MLSTRKHEASKPVPEVRRPTLQLEALEERLAPCGCDCCGCCPAIGVGAGVSVGVAAGAGAALAL